MPCMQHYIYQCGGGGCYEHVVASSIHPDASPNNDAKRHHAGTSSLLYFIHQIFLAVCKDCHLFGHGDDYYFSHTGLPQVVTKATKSMAGPNTVADHQYIDAAIILQ